MTPEKFAQWLAEFNQTLNGAPTKTQWQQIQEVLASVEAPQPMLFTIPGHLPDIFPVITC